MTAEEFNRRMSDTMKNRELPLGASSWCGPMWLQGFAQPCDGSCGCGKNPNITIIERDGKLVRRGEIDDVIVEGPLS